MYPLRVNGGGHDSVPSRQDLLANFDDVFTSTVVAAIEGAEPKAVLCRHGDEAMLGNGVPWASVAAGQLRVSVVNQ